MDNSTYSLSVLMVTYGPYQSTLSNINSNRNVINERLIINDMTAISACLLCPLCHNKLLNARNKFLKYPSTSIISVPSPQFDQFTKIYSDICTDLNAGLSVYNDDYTCWLTPTDKPWFVGGVHTNFIEIFFTITTITII